MKIFKKIITLILCLAVLSSSLMLSSCMYLLQGERDKDYITKEELDAALSGLLAGDVTVEGGDNYDITIEGADRTIAAASKSLLSAVSVICSFSVKGSTGIGGTQTSVAYSAGSGVIYKLDKTSGDAYVITNYHVVYNNQAIGTNKISEDISLFLYGMENTAYAIPATYVGGSMQYDLAVLKVEGSRVLAESNAAPAVFANSNDIAVLDTAIAVGNPESEGISATVGYVNVDSEYVTLNFTDTTGTVEVELRVMRMDTAVNSGNSGGGLYNSEGQLIGIVNSKLSGTTSSGSAIENMGYAIPMSSVMKCINDLREYGYVTGVARLGVTVSSYLKLGNQSYSGVSIVKTLVSGGSAELAGMKIDDVLYKINGETISSFESLKKMITAYSVGDSVQITVLRPTESALKQTNPYAYLRECEEITLTLTFVEFNPNA
jgi:serine protease Do